jgi:hypothetical protein
LLLFRARLSLVISDLVSLEVGSAEELLTLMQQALRVREALSRKAALTKYDAAHVHTYRYLYLYRYRYS